MTERAIEFLDAYADLEPHGKPTQKPIGILTAADLLALIEMF